MATSSLKLGPQLRKISAKSMEKAERVVKASLIELGTNVITRTPVDTGQARRNWLYAYGAADRSTTTETDRTGGERIGALTKSVSVLDIGDEFYMTNSLPYIKRLEYEGWSNQAPSGMVRVSTVDWPQIVDINVKRQSK